MWCREACYSRGTCASRHGSRRGRGRVIEFRGGGAADVLGAAVLQPLAIAVAGGSEIGDRGRDLLGEVSGRFDVVGIVSGTVLSGIDAVGN